MGKQSYGSKGHEWHPDFIKYMEFIAKHPTYQGMPDAFVDGGKIQWEAPSNRSGGRYKDTHLKRLEWWRNKATSIGIDIRSAHWISRTAKTIHPTKKKPCKRCGRVMDIRYSYPQQRFFGHLKKLSCVKPDFEFIPSEHILELLTRIVKHCGTESIPSILPVLKKTGLEPQETISNLAELLNWVDKVVVPSEPRLFSPGAMSNAPDRFDGFHSFNLCCRSKADTGRHAGNLRTYTTDRRVFEYWTEGDWIAADRLMGQMREAFRDANCMNGHIGPCDIDHIGPISLGFTHRAEFQLLCKTCNSAKNNRMCKRDVDMLIRAEREGEQVISWYAKELWDLRKTSVNSDETALRLSKLLRDNRHSYMSMLGSIAQKGHFLFLTTLLELRYADRVAEFDTLKLNRYLTCAGTATFRSRETKYAIEQKVRRCRIAFTSLLKYLTKENRNSYIIVAEESNKAFTKACCILSKAATQSANLDKQILEVLSKENLTWEHDLRNLIPEIEEMGQQVLFREARQQLQLAMNAIGKQLSSMWNDDRYVRTDSTAEDLAE